MCNESYPRSMFLGQSHHQSIFLSGGADMTFRKKMLAAIIMLCAIAPSCSSFSKSMNSLMSIPEESVDEKDFDTVPFEMAINRSFETQLTGKKFKFSARYKGTAPNPGKYKSVQDFTNLKMCDLNKSEVCTDLIVIKSTYAKTVFSLSDNQPVDVYGELLKVSGMTVGTSTEVNFAANNMKAPYSFVRAFKVVPAGQKLKSNSPAPTPTPAQASASTKIENKKIGNAKTKEVDKQPMDMATAQELLNRKGYNSGTPDGKYGRKTREAILKFQKDNGLAQSGSLDKDTIAKLRADQ